MKYLQESGSQSKMGKGKGNLLKIFKTSFLLKEQNQIMESLGKSAA